MAQVLRARQEAEVFGAALEAPLECGERWRVLPGKALPCREDLAGRIAQIEERLAARRDQAAQVGAVREPVAVVAVAVPCGGGRAAERCPYTDTYHCGCSAGHLGTTARLPLPGLPP